MKKFVDVVLPLPLKTLTYCIPCIYQGKVQIGSSVLVPLRTSKLLMAIVVKLHNQEPNYPTKELLGMVHKEPLFTPQQLIFLDWMAQYYLSFLGETLSMAFPQALHFTQSILFKSNGVIADPIVEENEQRILKALQYQPLTYKTINQLVGRKEAGKALIS